MKWFYLSLISIGLTGCSFQLEPSKFKFDSYHNIALDAEIDHGSILSSSISPEVVKQQIRKQLMFSIGQLNGLGGGVDMNRLKSRIISTESLDNGIYKHYYSAKMFISWPREQQVPASYKFILPENTETGALAGFLDLYGPNGSYGRGCSSYSTYDFGASVYWYYYRPEKYNCPLRDSSLPKKALHIRSKFKVSDENTTEKYPEYGKVWEDQRLVITTIFGKNDSGSTDHNDAGVRAFRSFYFDLLDLLGPPLTSNIENRTPGNDSPLIKLTFEVEAGLVDLHIFLVDGIRSVSNDFVAKYNKRTEISDFVSYNGHSGLGANIRALARMGNFQRGQYQIFLINGCDTFAYVDDALNTAHRNVNPDYPATKYLDLITNATPSYFHENSRANISVIDSLLNKDKTYRQILSSFDISQRAAVTGEEDNLWPLPFH